MQLIGWSIILDFQSLFKSAIPKFVCEYIPNYVSKFATVGVLTPEGNIDLGKLFTEIPKYST